MRTRPVACLALLVFLLLTVLPPELFYEPRPVEEKCQAQITGQVARRTNKNDKTQLDLTDCQVRTGETEFRTDHLLVYLTDAAEYPLGTVLSLSGTIYPTEEPTNPGQFDSRLYYEGKGVSYTVFAESAKILEVQEKPVREALLRLQERIGQVYDAVLDEQDSSLLKAMVLGEKAGLDTEIRELYQKNGISHLLAISGLHISLVGLGLYRLLRRLSGSCLWSGLPAMGLIWAYGWTTGASLSAVRAALMCSLVILADLTGRTYDMLTGTGAAAIIFMLTDPLNVRQSAFLLSFGAVTAIGLIQPLWRFLRPRQGKIQQSLGTGASVLFLTFPLLLRFFCEYPLYSTILNLLVIPLMSVLMGAGILCGLSGLVCMPAARLAGILCHLILELYAWMGEKCLSLPGAVLSMGSPAGWKMVLYYLALSVLLLVFYREKRRKKYWRGKEDAFRLRRGRLAASAGLFVLTVFLLCLRVHGGLSVIMLDVGQGDGIFFRGPDGTTFLCDGGSSNVSGVGTYRILPFLKWEGVGTLDYLLISHMDQDHISGIRELLEGGRKTGGLRIGHAVLPDLSAKDEAYLEMEGLLKEAEIPILYMGTGDRLEGEDYSLTCLCPAADVLSDDRNDLSLVLLAEYGEFQMLLTGDIGEKTERALVSADVLEEIEILKVPHHGSRYSSTEAFLARLRPAVSLISCSESNRYGHPGKETLERLEAAGSRVFITKDCGAIRVWTDGKMVRVKCFRD